MVAARQRLDSTYAQLLQLLKRAHAQARDHTTRCQLKDVRIEIVTAAARPISHPAASAWRLDNTQEIAVDD